jgi:hypothetical protein
MKIRFAVDIALGVLMSACSHQTEIWTATQATQVYASESDTDTRILFTLNPGDSCEPLREVMMKSYLHTEIQCKRGRGWVIDKQNFVVKPNEARNR